MCWFGVSSLVPPARAVQVLQEWQFPSPELALDAEEAELGFENNTRFFKQEALFLLQRIRKLYMMPPSVRSRD